MSEVLAGKRRNEKRGLNPVFETVSDGRAGTGRKICRWQQEGTSGSMAQWLFSVLQHHPHLAQWYSGLSNLTPIEV